mmetsp:Transcript_16812/g.52199  ORF Transcript_16812/g.52199 Transcript_16812/m.52199 type:complete len:215 (-) Transcript_16812:626-1270(-)
MRAASISTLAARPARRISGCTCAPPVAQLVSRTTAANSASPAKTEESSPTSAPHKASHVHRWWQQVATHTAGGRTRCAAPVEIALCNAKSVHPPHRCFPQITHRVSAASVEFRVTAANLEREKSLASMRTRSMGVPSCRSERSHMSRNQPRSTATTRVHKLDGGREPAFPRTHLQVAVILRREDVRRCHGSEQGAVLLAVLAAALRDVLRHVRG